MKRRILLVALLLFFSLVIYADAINPRLNLKGIARLDYNEIDLYHYHKGFSITAYPNNPLGSYQVYTEEELLFDEKKVILTAKFGNIELYPPIHLSLETYLTNEFYKYFKREFLSKCRELLGDVDREQGQGLIPEIVIQLPKIALPKSVRRFMGDKAGRLNLNGSQRLTFAGRYTKRSEPGGERDQETKFTPEMRQDLNLRLRGTIGEKIHVNVNHQSTSDQDAIPTPSEININYEGDEDEIISTIDGGNISLSLSGSKFISYSASSEGLFGIKSELRAGNLRVTTIMGKDEAEKNTQTWQGDSRPDSLDLRSSSFVPRTHYYLEHPSSLYDLYDDSDGDEGVDYPLGWKNNAIKINPESGKWQLAPNAYGALPDLTKNFTVYLDDGSASNNLMTIEGVNYADPSQLYNFDILQEGTDYRVDNDAGVLIMLIPQVNKIYSIGVTYTRNDGIVVGNDSSSPVEVKMLRIRNQESSDEAYWDLQVRNIYNLGMENIKNDGFEINVYTLPAGGTTPDYNAPQEVTTETIQTINDYLRLDTNNDGIINGEDSAVNLIKGYINFPLIKPFNALNDSIIYQEENVQITDINNYIFVKGKIGREQVSLGRMNILPGSIVIKIGHDKRKLTEKIDYIADYDFGIITFLTPEAKDPETEIFIDYQFRPLFAMDSKTIMGMRADMRFNDNIKLGGTFVYQSEKVREVRPKIGNENRSIILADIDGEIEYEVPFLTKLIDWLPLVKTDTKSTVTLNGEVAMSLPRIYGSDKQHDKKEAYLDDMESTMEVYPLGITRSTWSFSSRPADASGNLIDIGKAKINYYNPNDIFARDVYDPASMTEKEEREKVSMLACKIKPPDIGMPGVNMKYWAGLMKYVGNQVDFSKKKYIEILAKVDTLNFNVDSNPVTMHIDLGFVCEDFYKPGENPKPDKEDGLVNADGVLEGGEDLGLDRIKTGNPGDDPDDNYNNNKVTLNGAEEYPNINGTEGNDRLDTEDLNDNGVLDENNIYFEYSVSLNEGIEFMEGEYNGWRLFRIPLHNPDNYRIISDDPNKVPNIRKIDSSRIWFEVEDSTRVRIVNLDIVGNKWEVGLIKNLDGTVATNNPEIMQVSISDNQTGQHYTPAPHTVIKDNGEATLEQSLKIDYKDMPENNYGLITQRFINSYNLLSYSKIRYWVYAEKPRIGYFPIEEDSLLIRLGADSVNYYEIKQPLDLQEYSTVMSEEGWKQIEVSFSDFTQLKNLDRRDGRASYYIGDLKLSIVGNPSLSDVRLMSLGAEASNQFSGRIYFDDIRVADPYEDIGLASSANFTTVFADFATFNAGLDYRSENFQSSARRTTNVSYVQQTDFNISNRLNLNKFLPAEWGMAIPVNLSRTQSIGIPRFKSGSDLLRKDLLPEDKERETNKNLAYRADVSISQNKTPKSKILAYTLKNTTVSGNIRKSLNKSATSADTTTTYSLKHVYSLNIPREKIDLGLFSNYKFHFFPYAISNSLTLRNTEPSAWRWDTYTDSIPHWVPNTNSIKTRTFETSSSIDYDLLSDVSTSYDLSTKRDLMLKKYWNGYNIGEEKERTQTVALGFDPHYYDKVFSFNANATVTYDDNHIKSGIQDTLYFRGSVNRTIGGNFTFKNQSLLQSLAVWVDEKFSKKSDEKEPEQEMEEIQPLDESDLPEEPQDETISLPEPKGGNDKEGEDEIIIFDDPEKVPDSGEKKSGSTSGKERKQGRKTNVISSVISYLGGLSNIGVTYNNNYRTAYDDRLQRPELLYQLGFPHILVETGDDKDILLKVISNKYSTSASFPIIKTLTTNFGYSKENIKSYTNISSEKISTTFPNVSVTLTEFEKIIHAANFLTSSRITSSYVYSEQLNGDIGFTTPDTEQKRISLTPLFSWNGNWIHNITSSFSLNYTDQQNITHRVNYDDIRHSVTKSLNSNLSWSFSNPKGIKILFFKRTNLKNEFTTNVNFNLEEIKTTRKGAEDIIKEVDKISYRITPGASYDFSRSITAGLTSEYEWSNDKKRDSSSSMFRLSIWIEIIF
ncbi:MAG: cell surface protein SprA [Candidatus Cloacimonetes bacterium]|nr:cell surface protein SprA [Candidatus Cloacimonadota bacterium]